jgi:signal transduction histidine kinase
VARHAHASQAELTLSATAEVLTLDVVDDGVGIGETTRRSGLANLRERAERLGGSMVIMSQASEESPATEEGTHLRWTIPLS